MQTKAHVKASMKYNKENYVKFQCNLTKDESKLLNDLLANFKLNKHEFVVKAMNILSKDKSE